MPIQKNRSRDIPGKTGWSENDREKILDVVLHPEKYGVEPDDTEEKPKKPGCWVMMLQVLFWILWILMMTAPSRVID